MTDAVADPEADPDADERLGAPDGGPPDGGDGDGRAARGWDRVLAPLRRWAAMPAEGWISLVVVVGCVAFVASQLGFTFGRHELFGLTFGSDNLLLEDTTPAGGDMGAHVWGPAFLRDELLPQGRLTGWTQDWYAGFPAYHFYMIVPSLLIALLSLVIPYGIAFKLVAVSGVVSLPVSAWAFGRLTRLPFPAPPLLAVGATAFLFDRSFSIYGGNIASTLAGEFAFSMSLSLLVVYLGVLHRGLATGRYRVLTPVLLALVGLTHLIPAIFAVGATMVMLAVHPGSSPPWRRLAQWAGAVGLAAGGVLALVHLWPDAWELAFDEPGGSRPLPDAVIWVAWGVVAAAAVAWVALAPGARRWWWMVTTMPVAAALAAFWVLPFYLRSPYLNDMGWEKKTNYLTLLFDRSNDAPGQGLDSGLVDSPPLQLVLVLAAVGLLLSLLARRRAGLFLAATAAVAALGFWLAPEGRLWNARLTPFYYLCLYLLAAIAVAELGRLLSALLAPDVTRPLRPVRWAAAGLGTVVVLIGLGLPLHALPRGGLAEDGVTYRWGPLETTDNSFIDSWARWNFTGYEGKDAWPEYREIVATMDEVGRTEGCGRAMWEHEEQHDRYGTPMALMLLPFWTSGCIGSMEGLYFEASATTPYHFLNQDQLSQGPSNAQRDLPYGPGAPTSADFDLGVDHLQMLGVRYYLAISAAMQGYADEHPDLSLVATSGPWRVYEVADAPLVEGLANEPVVVAGADAGGHAWQDLSVCWYQDPDAWAVPLAADGPDGWARVDQTVEPPEDATPAQACSPGDWGWFGEPPPVTPVDPVEVTDVATTQDSISFRVDRTGVPVVVKASYFPNWQVDGAEGPYRLTPNLMVVVPTDDEVALTYGWTGVDLASYGLSLLGLVALVLLWRAGPVAVPPPSPFWAPGERDEDEPPPSGPPEGAPWAVAVPGAAPGEPPWALADGSVAVPGAAAPVDDDVAAGDGGAEEGAVAEDVAAGDDGAGDGAVVDDEAGRGAVGDVGAGDEPAWGRALGDDPSAGPTPGAADGPSVAEGGASDEGRSEGDPGHGRGGPR